MRPYEENEIIKELFTFLEKPKSIVFSTIKNKLSITKKQKKILLDDGWIITDGGEK